MLPQSKVEAVREMAAQGLSQRAIAQQSGVARMTVRRILSGERPDRAPSAADDDLGLFRGPVGRCPACGAKVHLPCLACEIAAKKEMERLSRREIPFRSTRRFGGEDAASNRAA